MSAHLHNNTTVPAGGFRYWVAQTQIWVKGATYHDWISNVKAHCRANEIEPPTPAEMETQLCELLDGDWCAYGSEAERVRASRMGRLTLDRLRQGTQTLVDWYIGGRTKVDAETADKRGITCSKCFYNQNAEGCTPCNAGVIRKLADKVVGGSRTSVDGKLQACRICGCSNKAQIWLPLETLQKHMSRETRDSLPDWCWKK